MPDIIIRGKKIDFVESVFNLGVIFNGWLTWSNHINVIVGKVYGMLRNLWAYVKGVESSFYHGQNVLDSCSFIWI